MMKIFRVGVLLLGLVCMVSCGSGQEEELPVSREVEQQIQSEFDELLVGTSKAADSQLERFKYSDGRNADLAGKDLGFKTPCGQNDAGETLYHVSIQINNDTAKYSKAEYEAKVQAVRDYWKSKGLEPRNFDSGDNYVEVIATTDAGTIVKYSAGDNSEFVSADTRCIFSTSPSPS